MAQQGPQGTGNTEEKVEEPPPIDFDAILHEDDPDIREKREQEERKRISALLKKEDDSQIKQREILEKIYNIKPKDKGLDDFVPKDDDEEEEVVDDEEVWENYPKDKENWTEGDLDEEWIDPPPNATHMFYDPKLGITGVPQEDDDDDELKGLRSRRGKDKKNKGVKKEKKLPPGLRTPEIYVPFRRPLPIIPRDDEDIDGPDGVLKELEMAEEFLDWDSYVFKDGATYEGTTFRDLAQGKGVYTTATELCKYEGEWQQNMMQGHGVMTVDVPQRVPPPGSRAAGTDGEVLQEKYMSAEDKEWLKMEIEDLTNLAKIPKEKRAPELKNPRLRSITDNQPFEERPFWKKIFGRNPPKGRYKYSGQLKHNRMHGCGVHELNGQMIWGKWYFGDLLNDPGECDLQTSGFHAAMAEVAASKARMFTNKPDGMVREVRGPYTDPSHPYMYDEEDMWMAPGFINEFHKVPQMWSKYVDEVDEERNMWLNSFTQAPFRIPMPPELEQLWDQESEFVLLGNVPSKEGVVTEEDKKMAQPDMQGKVLLHIPSKQIINWVEDNDGKLRMFVQPFVQDGKVDPNLVRFLPLGFEEFMKDEDLDMPAGDLDSGNKKLNRREQYVQSLKQKWDIEDRRRKARRAADDRETQKEKILRDMEDREDQIFRMEEMARELELEDEVYQAQLKALAAKAERLINGEPEEEEGGEVAGDGGEEEEEKGAVAGAEEKEKEEESKEGEGEKQGKEEREEEGEDAIVPPVSAVQEGGDEEDEEDDEDEDEKKPRSFGKVAMVDFEVMREAWQSRFNGTENPRGPPPAFPTVFASISLASQAGMGLLMQSALGALQGLRQRSPIRSRQLSPTKAGPRSAFPSPEEDERPGVAFVKLGPATVRRVPGVALRSAPNAVDLNAGQKRAYGRRPGQGKVWEDAQLQRKTFGLKVRKADNGQQEKNIGGVEASPCGDRLWAEPIHAFLSLAFPLPEEESC